MMGVVAVAAVLLAVIPTVAYYVSPPYGVIHAEGNRLVAGIESWRSYHGRYPLSLEEAGLGSPIPYRGGFRYCPLGSGYELWIGVADGVHLRHTFASARRAWYCAWEPITFADPLDDPRQFSGRAPIMRLPRVRFTVLRMMVVVVVAALFFSSVGSYYRLSRRGMREAAELQVPGFLYVSLREVTETEDLSRQYALAVLYAPLNWLDRHIFGSPGPTILKGSTAPRQRSRQT
jgi:hypothetical protein